MREHGVATGERWSLRFILLLALADAGGVIGFLPLPGLLLPVKVAGTAGDDRIAVFTATVIAGPALTWALATPRDFSPVMLMLAGLTLLGGLLVLAIRHRR